MKPNRAKQKPRWLAYLPAALVGVVGVALSLGAAVWLHREAVRRDRERVGEIAHRIRAALDTRVEKYQLGLEGLRDMLSWNPGMTKAEWRMRLNAIDPQSCYAAFLRIGHWRAEPVEEWPAETEPPFPVERWAELESIVRSLREYKFNFHPNLSWTYPGMVMPPDEIIPVADARAAIRSSRPRITPARIIATNRKQGAIRGTILIVPLLGKDLARAWEYPLAESRYIAARFRFQEGVAYGAIDWNRFLADTTDARFDEVACEIFSSPEPREDSRLNLIPPESSAMANANNWLTHINAPSMPLQTNLVWSMFMDKWCLAFTSTPKFAAQSTRYRAWLALGAGSAVSLLMSGLLAVQIRGRRRDASHADALIEAQRERMQISRDLHDGAIQSLYAVQLALGRLHDRLGKLSAPSGNLLSESRQSLNDVIAELRRFLVHDPEPIPRAAAADLSAVITALVQRLQSTTDARLVAELDDEAVRTVPAATALQIAALAGEALSNAVRHARAHEVHLRFGPAPDAGWRLEISDDGVGFDLNNLVRRSGLVHLEGRAADLGGKLTIETSPGKGTRVCADLPRST